jgi:hypothetical protein
VTLFKEHENLNIRDFMLLDNRGHILKIPPGKISQCHLGEKYEKGRDKLRNGEAERGHGK